MVNFCSLCKLAVIGLALSRPEHFFVDFSMQFASNIQFWNNENIFLLAFSYPETWNIAKTASKTRAKQRRSSDTRALLFCCCFASALNYRKYRKFAPAGDVNFTCKSYLRRLKRSASITLSNTVLLSSSISLNLFFGNGFGSTWNVNGFKYVWKHCSIW